MGKQLSEKSIKFIKNNWLKMENKALAKSIGASVNYMTVKARELGLPDKRTFRQEGTERQIIAAEIEDYKESMEAELEKEGRKKKLYLQYIREQIKNNDSLRLKIKEERGSRILGGSIVQKTDNLVILQVGKYRESFAYVDFFTGRAIIV